MATAHKMLSPPRSPFHPPVSPPPSDSLLKLQRLGLELGSHASKGSLIPSYNTSARTTPSDLDKPLPLEPPEVRRRTSSIYSNETTISNILAMYGGFRDDEEDDDGTRFHSPQAYRDTVAPLLARRLSETHTTWIPPMVPHRLRTSVSIPSMRHTEQSPARSTTDSKSAPSFVEFSRNLRERRNEIFSPTSAESYEHHRQEALEKLAPPSTQDSSEALPVAYEQAQSFLPGPMSGTITDVVTPDLLPEPLDLSRTSRVLRSPQDTARKAQGEWLEYPTQQYQQYQQPDTEQSWARVMQRLNKRKSSEHKEKDRVLQHASEKYPGMKSPHQQRRASQRSSGASISRRASNLISAFSCPGGKNDQTAASATAPRRQKQLAVKSTPYQEYGPDIWLPPEKQEKKRKREEGKLQRATREPEQKGHRRQRSSAASKASKGSDFSTAYHSGQSQIVGVLEGARQRLSRSSSEKRREKLKKSIVLVGPTQLTKDKNAFEGAGGET